MMTTQTKPQEAQDAPATYAGRAVKTAEMLATKVDPFVPSVAKVRGSDSLFLNFEEID